MSSNNDRIAEHGVTSIFVERWSPRALTGEPMPDATLHRILEAARWAPSAYNAQPWRFLYARRGTKHFETFEKLLVEGNQIWAKNASVLLILISRKTMRPPNAAADIAALSHSFDAGAAWGYLALEAQLAGWAAHAMLGLDRDRARTTLTIPDDFHIEAAIALGKRGDKASLPEALQMREAPSPRNPQSAFVFEGVFPHN